MCKNRKLSLLLLLSASLLPPLAAASALDIAIDLELERELVTLYNSPAPVPPPATLPTGRPDQATELHELTALVQVDAPFLGDELIGAGVVPKPATTPVARRPDDATALADLVPVQATTAAPVASPESSWSESVPAAAVGNARDSFLAGLDEELAVLATENRSAEAAATTRANDFGTTFELFDEVDPRLLTEADQDLIIVDLLPFTQTAAVTAPASRSPSTPTVAVAPGPNSPQPVLPELAIDEPALAQLPTPAPLFAETPPAAVPSIQDVAVDIREVERQVELVERHCRDGELAQAREVYAALPGYGGHPEANRLRADAANLLILHYGLTGDLDEARRLFDEIPDTLPGAASLSGRTRAIMNLVTFYVRDERLGDGYALFRVLQTTTPHPDTDPELFRLSARLIPYLDAAEMNGEAARVHAFMAARVDGQRTFDLYARHVPAVFKQLLGKPSVVHNTPEQERRRSLAESMFAGLPNVPGVPSSRDLRLDTAEFLLHFYTAIGDRPKALEMRSLLTAGGRSAAGS